MGKKIYLWVNFFISMSLGLQNQNFQLSDLTKSVEV